MNNLIVKRNNKMFEVFKTPTIKEDTTKNQIIVEGINLKLVYRDFEKYIGSKMLYNILDKSSRWEMKFQKFYLPDMYHVVLELLNNDKFKRRIVSRSKLQKLKELFETIPLVQNIKLIQNTKDEDIPVVNKSILKNIFVPGLKLFEHQDKFIDNCLFKSKLMDLRGYLLDAGPGLGKTINSIALMELLGADKIIVVCPKKAVIDVWEETINRIYSKSQTYNLSIDSVKGGKVKLANFSLDSKFMVCHFESLDKLVASLRNIPSGRYGIVLDEAHGMNSYKSQRSTLFRELNKIVNPYFCLWMSGTPLKALGSETMTMFETIDKLFTPEVVKSFNSVFGISGVYAASVMANRLQLVKATIKAQGSGVEQFTYQSKVVLPDAWKYTLSTIREEMKKYIRERTAFYNEFRDEYIEEYFEGIEEFKANLGSNFNTKMQIALDEYLAKTKELHNGYNPTSPVHKQYIIDCNYFEDKVIIPILSNKTKKIFRKAKSVYKYVELTIIGETLGNVIGRKRTECNKAIVEAMAKSFTVVSEDGKETYETNLSEVIRDAEAKTLIFTDYVDVLKHCNEILTEEGFHPITIFGETTTTIGLSNQVKQFKENSKINPLITTFKTLSEAVPLTEANTVIFLNLPFRSGTYDQAVKRANRIGQTKDVHLYEVTLDTGGEENISTRNLDILKWSEEQVSILMGDKKGEVEEVSKLTIDHFLPDVITRGIPSIKDFKMF
nr:MAG TPA: Chromatin remodeling complex ATPase [Caudoviricetes sp.]